MGSRGSNLSRSLMVAANGSRKTTGRRLHVRRAERFQDRRMRDSKSYHDGSMTIKDPDAD